DARRSRDGDRAARRNVGRARARRDRNAELGRAGGFRAGHGDPDRQQLGPRAVVHQLMRALTWAPPGVGTTIVDTAAASSLFQLRVRYAAPPIPASKPAAASP